jgi:hypothetical protein
MATTPIGAVRFNGPGTASMGVVALSLCALYIALSFFRNPRTQLMWSTLSDLHVLTAHWLL